MASSLEGKKIVVIGGSSGVGFGAAKAALLDRAAEVIVVSSSKSKVDDAVERLRKIVASTAGLNGVAKGEVVDATNSAQVKALFERVGEIDHLVWTSGGSIDSNARLAIKETDLDTRRSEHITSLRLLIPLRLRRSKVTVLNFFTLDLFDLKFWGAATAAQAAKFRGGSAASLTLTTGTAQIKPPPGWALISSMVGAVDTLGRGLAVDLAPVRVNVIAPGLVKTEVSLIIKLFNQIQVLGYDYQT